MYKVMETSSQIIVKVSLTTNLIAVVNKASPYLNRHRPPRQTMISHQLNKISPVKMNNQTPKKKKKKHPKSPSCPLLYLILMRCSRPNKSKSSKIRKTKNRLSQVKSLQRKQKQAKYVHISTNRINPKERSRILICNPLTCKVFIQ